MPTAGPHTDATSGLGNVTSARRKRDTCESLPDGGLFRKSPMSLPAENTVSWPWITATRTAASDAALASASASTPYIAEVIEFLRSRRLNVSVITPRSVLTRMSLLMASLLEVIDLAGGGEQRA